MFNSQFIHQLHKEASRRTRKLDIVDIRSSDLIKSSLYKEAQVKINSIKRQAALSKRSMSYHAGQRKFGNSNVTWSKVDLTPQMAAVDAQIEKAFKPYFYALINGRQSGIVPPNLVLRYEAHRDLFPVVDRNDPDSQMAHNDALNAVKVMDSIVSGFSEFVKDLDNAAFPLLMYFQNSYRSKEDGQYSTEELTHFVKSEKQKFQRQPLQVNGINVSDDYYKEHAQSDNVFPTMTSGANRQYNLSDIDRETSTNKIAKWVAFAFRKGFNLHLPGMMQEIQQKEEESLQRNGLLQINKLTPQQQEWRRSIMHFYSGRDLKNPQQPTAASSMAGRIKTAYEYGCGPLKDDPNKKGRQTDWGKDPAQPQQTRRGLPPEDKWKDVNEQSCPRLGIEEMRLIGKHMVGEHPDIRAGTYIVPDETSFYHANGLDSQATDPTKTMLIIPDLKRLPSTGQLVYDKDQGNFMGNHLRKYGDVLTKFLAKWGQWANNALKILHSDQSYNTLAQLTHQQNTDADNFVPADAREVIIKNRTNADAVLEMITKCKDYSSLFYNVLNKTMASAITNFNYYAGSKDQGKKQKQKQRYTPTGAFQLVQPDPTVLSGQGMDKLFNWVQQINNALRNNKQEGVQDKAKSDIHEMAYHLSKLHATNPRMFNWDQYSGAMSILGNITTDGQRPVVSNLSSIVSEDKEHMLKADGFQQFQQFGYQVAKMMDLVSCLMIRSCDDSSQSRLSRRGEIIPENKFGATYSAGQGKSGSTKLMLGIRYAFRAEEIGAGDQELLKQVRYHRGKRKLKVPPGGVDILPQTQHPERGTPVQDQFQNQAAGKIIENITYWVGQASGSGDFHKGLNEGKNGELALKGMSWRQVIDYVERQYPQLVSQLGLTFEPVNIDLRRLQEATKRALLKVTEEMDAAAIFEDEEGNQTAITPDAVQDDTALVSEYKEVLQDNKVTVLDAPADETVLDMPEQSQSQEETSQPTDESAPDMDPRGIQEIIDELWDIAEDSDNKSAMKSIEKIDAQLTKRQITDNAARISLDKVKQQLYGSEQEAIDQVEMGLINYWEGRLADDPGSMLETDLIRLDAVLDRMKMYAARKKMQLPPNIVAYIAESTNVNQQVNQYKIPDQPEETYDPEFDEDNAMLMKSMPMEPSNFIGKRKSTRRLVRHRPDLNTGKLTQSDVINVLTKLANKLDDSGEYTTADKIDMLLNRVTRAYYAS